MNTHVRSLMSSQAELIRGQIRLQRVKLGISQAQMAKAIGRSQAAYSRKESGRDAMSLDELVTITDALGLRVVVALR